jgi:Cu/Ag efflux protein CusF
MNPTRSLARAVAFASLVSAVSFAAHAAQLPIASEALESHVTTEVTAIDLANRQVTVKGPHDKDVIFQLTEQAKALPNLKVGDQIDIKVTRAVAYVLNTQEGGAPKASVESGTIRATAANPNPGGEAFRQVKVTSQIKKIDLAAHEVTLLPPEGKLQVVKVEDPELQARMKNLKVDQTVEAIYTEVLSVETSRPAQ